MNVNMGEKLRHAWLGMEPDPLIQSDKLLKAYTRQTEPRTDSSSKWFISKNPIVSGLLGFTQRNGDTTEGEAPSPKAKRKRIVRKKVPSSSL